MWTGPHRFSPVFLRIQERKDQLRLRSMALGGKRPDRTGLPNTTHSLRDHSFAETKDNPVKPDNYTVHSSVRTNADQGPGLNGLDLRVEPGLDLFGPART